MPASSESLTVPPSDDGRANAGAFWSGYECQIRNQWQGDDRTKAVDYGTAGLYNRQPARKVVSSDREWFTLTVVAHGYHIAIWNNGYGKLNR